MNITKKNFHIVNFIIVVKIFRAKKKCLFQKNHDFYLNLKINLNINLNEKMIILYRKDKILQLESLFSYDKFFKNDYYNATIDYKNEKNFNDLIKYIKDKSKYYDGFVNKYIKFNRYKKALIIEYHDFLSKYKDYIKQLILFLNLLNTENNDYDIDNDVQNIINTFEKIEYKNNLSIEDYQNIYKAIF